MGRGAAQPHGELLEIFDHEVGEVRKAVANSLELKSRRIIGVLEPLFLRVARAPFDKDLSIEVVELVGPLVDDTDLEATRQLVERHEARLRKVLERVQNRASGAGVLLTQPEGLLLLHLLQTKRNQLRALWETKYAVDWLDDVAEQWGIRLGTRD